MVFISQLEFLSTAINKLDGSPLFWLLLVTIVSIVLMQFKDVFKLFAEAFVKRKEMQLKYDEDTQNKKFERENKIVDALNLNSLSLKTVTDYLKERCGSHRHTLHELKNNLPLTQEDKNRLGECIDKVER